MMERTRLQELQGLFSDIHKDVHGFRPRSAWEENWNNEEWLENQLDSLSVELGEQMDHEAKVQAENVSRFEDRVEQVISCGAGDRETAISWMMDGEDVNGDIGYFEYLLNIPYGYVEGCNK